MVIHFIEVSTIIMFNDTAFDSELTLNYGSLAYDIFFWELFNLFLLK